MIPFIGFPGLVLMTAVASGPSPTCVTPAMVMLYLLPAFKFSRWYLVSEAGMLSHTNTQKKAGKKQTKTISLLQFGNLSFSNVSVS